jgi:DNA (cytosine-5)-methyltransferase 1
MKTISLFAGCGGMDLGAEQAGAEIVYANEVDETACATLRKVFRTTKVDARDIKEISSFPRADLLLGGYPCQSFSLGGNRRPEDDHRTYLYLEFARCLERVEPLFFVAENVKGLKSLQQGQWLQEQFRAFKSAGRRGYRVTAQLIDAKEYGVPQTRKRMVLVGVRRDHGKVFIFPSPTHGKRHAKNRSLKPFVSHGDAIADLPLWPQGEFYERPHDPEGHFSWYYMSRNRKAPWDGPSFTVVANWRHVTLHPASPKMTLTWSNLADGWKQRWDFSNEYEHTAGHPERPILEVPRRLSWRECARIQTFPKDFEPEGTVEEKFTQIGNAVPPLLARTIVKSLLDGSALYAPGQADRLERPAAPTQMQLWS